MNRQNNDLDGVEESAPTPGEDRVGGIGFSENYFNELVKCEDDYFWFQVRNELVLWAIKRYCAGFRSFLEIGCGTGYVLSAIDKTFPAAHIYGSEVLNKGFQFAIERVPNARFIQFDARNIPFKEEFELIGAFDVLEHINEDEAVISQVFNALEPNGVFIATVPQHMWLWSQNDEYAYHKRRYRVQELDKKLRAEGFEILRSTSFLSILVPLLYMSRRRSFKKSNEAKAHLDEYTIPKWLNSALRFLMRIDVTLIRLGVDLPIGGSRLTLARKPRGVRRKLIAK